jgi:hypothetical protein
MNKHSSLHTPLFMRKRCSSSLWLRLGALVLVVSIATACRANGDAANDITIDLPVPAARQNQALTLTVTVRDASDKPISGAVVTLRGDMTHGGMSPVITPLQAIGNGQYRTDQFQFTMAGDWVLTVDAALPDGRRAERSFPIGGVQ